MHAIYSTLNAPQVYVNYEKSPIGGFNEIARVAIRGNAGVIDRQSLITPLGARTEVTTEQLDILKANSAFQDHLAAGYITIREDDAPVEKVAPDMATDDSSRQITESDMPDNEVKVSAAGSVTVEVGAKGARA